MWVFGYGSLVWKVDFKYETKIIGYVKGYLRRFYQHSIDHRGVPEKPGRVVTLIPSDDANSAVWGIAYKIKAEDIEQVTNHLDFREKNGYSKKTVTFHPKEKTMDPFDLTLYVATQENESFAGKTYMLVAYNIFVSMFLPGPASIEEIANQIISCEGPSGSNREYVYNLAEAMRQLAPNIEDNHLFSLEKALCKLDADRK